MKKIFLLMMLLATVFVACSDDDDDDDKGKPTGKEKLVSKIVTDYGDSEICTTTFEYDSEGKMTKVIETYKGGEDDGDIVTRTFKKEGTKFMATYTNNYSNKGETIFNGELNDKGFVKSGVCVGSVEYDNIVYDLNNRLLYADNDKFALTWVDENITVVDSENDGRMSYTYTEYENKSNYDFNCQLMWIWEYDMYATSYFGVKSKNLIATMKDGSDTYSYEYAFDDKGYVTNIQKFELYNGGKELINTITVTYKE